MCQARSLAPRPLCRPPQAADPSLGRWFWSRRGRSALEGSTKLAVVPGRMWWWVEAVGAGVPAPRAFLAVVVQKLPGWTVFRKLCCLSLGCYAVNLSLHFKASFILNLTLSAFTPEITTLYVTLRRGKLLQSLFSAGEACLNSHLIYIFFFFFLNDRLCKLYAALPGAFHFISLHLLFLPSQNRKSSTSFTRVSVGPLARRSGVSRCWVCSSEKWK